MVLVIVLLVMVIVLMAVQMRRLSGEVEQKQRYGKVKVAFLRSIAHDIRVSLHSVNGLAEVIADESLYLSKSEKHNISDQIKHNAALVSTLLDELMVLGDSNSTGTLAAEEFSPNLLCRRCMETSVRQNDKAQLRIQFKRDLSDEFFIKTDVHLVELVLTKLIKNACRFTEQGEVVVGCNTNDIRDRLTFYVQDTGKGIPAERLDHLFHWFDNPDDAPDEVELDLSIAQKLAERLGGTLHVDATSAGGTRILFVLPIHQ